jgi:hypothetical protein
LKKINFFTYIFLPYFQKYFFMVLVLVLNLTKHFFNGLVPVPVPTSWCQLGSKLQELNLELSFFTLQTEYLHNIGWYQEQALGDHNQDQGDYECYEDHDLVDTKNKVAMIRIRAWWSPLAWPQSPST